MRLVSLLTAIALLTACSSGDSGAPSKKDVNVAVPGADDVVSSYKAHLDATPKSAEGAQVVAQIGDWKLTIADVDRKGGPNHLRRLRAVYNERFKQMESALASKLYELEGDAQGVTGKELFERKMKEVDVTPDTTGLDKIPADQQMAAVEEQIKEKMFTHHQRYIAELAKKYQVKILLDDPIALKEAKTLDGPMDREIVLGNSDAKVNVEIYTDFQCPFCRNVAPDVDQLMRKYIEKARFVFRPMINPEHPASRPASVIAMCVYRQSGGKFMDFHNVVFSRQDELAGGQHALLGMAESVGADMGELRDCMSDPDVRDSLEIGAQQAFEKGVSSTPTVVINGVPVVGDHDFNEYLRVLTAALDGKMG